MNSSNALVCASKDGTLGGVQAILSQPRDLWDSQLGDSLYEAIGRVDPEMVQLLLDNGAKLDRSSFGILRRRGNITLLEVFLAHGWDLDSTELDDGEPFIRCSVGKPHVINWLLSKGADPNATNKRGASALLTTALEPLVQGGVVINALLSHGAKIPPDILHRCIRPPANGGLEVLQFLIGKILETNDGALNHVTDGSGTPLHYAAYLGKEDEVRILLDAGAIPDMVIDDETPASLAKREGHMRIYEMLVARSNDPTGSG